MSLTDRIKRVLRSWFYVYRDENTGQFISKDEAMRRDFRDVMKHRRERPNAAETAARFKRENKR